MVRSERTTDAHESSHELREYMLTHLSIPRMSRLGVAEASPRALPVTRKRCQTATAEERIEWRKKQLPAQQRLNVVCYIYTSMQEWAWPDSGWQRCLQWATGHKNT